MSDLQQQNYNISPRSITTLPGLFSSLSELQSHEAALSGSLAALLSAREPILTSLSRIRALAPHIDELRQEAVHLFDKVSTTASTAERVGGRVKVLDEEMRRVREAAERVSQVMELKSSLLSLHSAMASQDWESATRYCARAMSIPIEVITGPFAETVVPTSEFPSPPVQTLQNAREELLVIFRTRFKQASQARDAAATSRFFKLFPVIGWEEEGLEAYSSFVVDLVQTRAPASAKTSSPMYYITMLTSVFENIALIVDQHQPVVEKYYGPGKMVTVVARLLGECDRVVKNLTDGWEEERSMQRKLTQTASPIFAILNPSSRKQASQGIPEDDIDPRDIDKVLSELAGMAGRWGLFRRFLWDRLKDGRDSANVSSRASYDDRGSNSSLVRNAEDEDIEQSSCSAGRYYSPLEIWYLRVTIDKAHRLSIPDPSAAPPTTTTPDDVFYILKVVINRVISTASPSTVERTAAQINEVIVKDFVGIVKKRLDDVYKNSGVSTTGPQREKVEKENKTLFIIYLNDLDMASSHVDRLVRDLLGASVLSQVFLESEITPIKRQLSSLLNIVPQLQSILTSGLEQLFNQLTRPRLRLLVVDMYKDATYMLDDEGFSLAESQDIARKRFIRSWDALVDGFRELFTENNYGIFFGLSVDILVRSWEKFIIGMRFTELGAIRFDHDMRSILGYLSSQTTFGDAREKFQRLQQISTLLNLDIEEDRDGFYNKSGINWHLSFNEARAITALRV